MTRQHMEGYKISCKNHTKHENNKTTTKTIIIIIIIIIIVF